VIKTENTEGRELDYCSEESTTEMTGLFKLVGADGLASSGVAANLLTVNCNEFSCDCLALFACNSVYKM